MAAALVPLQNITLSTTKTNVTFASIPTTGYRDLRIVIHCQGMSGNGVMATQFNSDTGSNYSYVGMYTESGTNGSESGATTFIKSSVSNVTTNEMFTIDVMDYSATDKHKTTLSRMGNAATNLAAYAGRWASTSAINAVKIYHTGTNVFGVGTTFELFGVVA